MTAILAGIAMVAYGIGADPDIHKLIGCGLAIAILGSVEVVIWVSNA